MCIFVGFDRYGTIMQDTQKNRLDAHSLSILEQYRRLHPGLTELSQELSAKIKSLVADAGLIVAAVESRVKSEDSLAGKLELKGAKYSDIYDITDILGLRIITFFIDDVENVASIMERHFDIDWDNSVDKRKAHEVDSFGYQSLHYICRVPEGSQATKTEPGLAGIRFEVQMRTVLQHAWANLNHDTGYKSGVEAPKVYLRQLSRLAGMLELVDDEFSRIRTEINDYRRKMQSLVASGKLEEVPLDGETFRSYLATEPFAALNHRIAAVNQAEIMDVPLGDFLALFKGIGMHSLGDIENLKRDYSDAAFQLARYQIGLTDLDIISSAIGPQNLCLAYILRSGSGRPGIKFMLDTINGPDESNDDMAAFLLEQAKSLPFMNQ